MSRKSTSGTLCKLASAAIMWQSKQQNCVAQSTTEAEYVSAASVCKDFIWIKRLLTKLSVTFEGKTLYIDNTSAIELLKNPVFHQRSKHIDVKYHFVRDLVTNKEISIKYIVSDQQAADILTKPLSKVKFNELREKLGLVFKEDLKSANIS